MLMRNVPDPVKKKRKASWLLIVASTPRRAVIPACRVVSCGDLASGEAFVGSD